MIFHITEQAAWQTAQAEGAYQPPSLASEGFIHFSTDAQVVATANRFYQGKTGLVLLTVDPSRLKPELRYEDTLNHGTFPHLYGPLNVDAVVDVRTFEPGADGTFSM
ncbi:MAG: DUF952 domain-containing protein [Phormidesmis sp.]